MKNVLLILMLAFASALGGYWTYYRCATAPARAMLTEQGGEMQWLRHEYHLSDAQFARVEQVHREYTPKCDLMCGNIMKANARLDQLISANKSVTPEVSAAMKECLAVQNECREAMLGHVYAVGSEMSPADGARYLEMMKARIVEPALGHSAAISESSK